MADETETAIDQPCVPTSGHSKDRLSHDSQIATNSQQQGSPEVFTTTRARREFDLTEQPAYRADKIYGVVANYDSGRGWGFLRRDGGDYRDIFVHVRELEKAGIASLSRGDRVAFDVETGPKGPRAIRVELVS